MNKRREQKPPLWIRILVTLSLFIGLITGVIGVDKVENYYHPYIFGIIFGGLGVLIGIWIARKFKPIIAVNDRMRKDYHVPTMCIVIGFAGLLLMSSAFINEELSGIDKYEYYQVINKYRQDSKFRQAEVNSLIVDLEGQSFRLVCSRSYWYQTPIGKHIKLCLHKSKLGFDFISIRNDKDRK